MVWYDVSWESKWTNSLFSPFFEEFAEIIEVKEQIILVSSWQVLRIAWRDKKWSKFGHLQTLCCQKVYYDSGLQVILRTSCSAGQKHTDLCKWNARSALWSHTTIQCIFVSFGDKKNRDLFFIAYLCGSAVWSHTANFIRSNKTSKHWASNDLAWLFLLSIPFF